jgi:hypothetical protein
MLKGMVLGRRVLRRLAIGILGLLESVRDVLVLCSSIVLLLRYDMAGDTRFVLAVHIGTIQLSDEIRSVDYGSG